jgi:hypothetical protein
VAGGRGTTKDEGPLRGTKDDRRRPFVTRVQAETRKADRAHYVDGSVEEKEAFLRIRFF